jgi:hypothetical protein
MSKDISFMQYMRAHGNTPGPTQRPLLTGAIAGLLAGIPSGAILYWSGAIAAIADWFQTNLGWILAIEAVLMILAGMLYAVIFKRAANDCEGGWLFGAGYGFLLWMFAPVTIWQTVTTTQIAVGGAAMGLFASHVLYGVVLGLLYPRIHALVKMRLSEAPKPKHKEKEIRRESAPRGKKTEFAAKTAKIQGGHQ